MGQQFFFFLGGNDLEMSEIKNILKANALPFADNGLAWHNATASAYSAQIQQALTDGFKPVLVELKPDIAEDVLAQCVIVDHHDANIAREASVLQVLALLGLEPNWRQRLIAANDSGYIPAMLQLGATREEIEQIRREDWKAQNISDELINEALTAYRNAQTVNGVLVIDMEHFCFAPVTDSAFWVQKRQNILFKFHEGRTLYFGPDDICTKVYDTFPKCWRGKGFVGNPDISLQAEIADLVLAQNA